MCNFDHTYYKTCGCTVSHEREQCGYQNDSFGQCMEYTVITDLEPQEGVCGRRNCKYKAPEVKKPEWILKKDQTQVETIEVQVQQAEVA